MPYVEWLDDPSPAERLKRYIAKPQKNASKERPATIGVAVATRPPNVQRMLQDVQKIKNNYFTKPAS
jgi:hypothetical protein